MSLEDFQAEMVRVMPNQNSAFSPPRATRAIFAVLTTATLFYASDTAHAAIQEAATDDSSFFSPYVIAIILVLLLVGLIVYKKTRPSSEWVDVEEPAPAPARTARADSALPATNRAQNEAGTFVERRAPPLEGTQQCEKPHAGEAETSIFGAYRIDQEVGKLLMGKAHRMDVMASRAADDRRAIEASLVKALDMSSTTEEARARARQALEEYGFVARQSATMLMGRDAWERSSAARTLGQIGSKSSLSFLVEALHDQDPVVRNQAVSSLGELRMPAAIGALLDIARRHPDIPASLLSETLSACSVESLSYLDGFSSEPAQLGDGLGSELPHVGNFMAFEDLPTGNEDDTLNEILTRLDSPDEQLRTKSVQELAAYPVQRSVAALSQVALEDPDSAIRSAAVTGLGAIDHESVFASVLIALADDSREVRAAAARTLNGLHFDRANAYVRVMETADKETLQTVARACVKTGIAAQAIDRLTSEDRHQAYEAFSLFSLLARANESKPILDTIQNHKDEEVRLCAIRALNAAGQAELAPQLRTMASGEGISENVRTALLEVLYKLDQDQPVFDLASSDNGALSLHNSL
jgi:HEAT repeat protein